MRVPSATYRVQFNLQFRFADAESLIPYLHSLGISHLYSSPKDKARKGSPHGYDVADPMQINSELGTEEEFARLVERLRQYGMGLLLDIVPNHMAASDENPWWMDVLENGRESPYADFFDIDWDSPGAKSPELQKNRVVVPLLSDLYERVLVNQGISLRLDEKGFYVQAEGSRAPINPKTYAVILEPCVQFLKSLTEFHATGVAKLEEVMSALNGLSAASENNVAGKDQRNDPKDQVKRGLWQLYREMPQIHNAIDESLRRFNGEKGSPASFNPLDSLLRLQAYRLTYWRTATEEVNYRRFFDINDLIALRVEDPRVFATTHAHIIQLVADGKISGLRVDHIDGLSDPRGYLERLQQARNAAAGDDNGSLNVYTIVEKITSGTETLPRDWPVAGTTGYDFLTALNTLFVDAKGSGELEAGYRDFTGIRSSFSDTWYVRKKQVMEDLFGSDIRVLSYRLGRLAAMDRLGRDVPMRELIRGLKEITARLSVYRSYFQRLELSARDRVYLAQALKVARDRTAAGVVSEAGFDFLARVLLLDPSLDETKDPKEWLDFLLRWQQFSGAVMAKGFEDTTFYVHLGLISLNEVGCNPFRKEMRFGVPAFHQFNLKTLKEHPHTLNATSTHDTKWSEDVRARINVLSELTREWRASLRRWSRMNKSKKVNVDGRVVPSPNEEVLIYQSLLGIWPPEREEQNSPEIRERMERYILKASREAKTHTSWVSPNEQHEAALRDFLSGILDTSRESRFRSDLSKFCEQIAVYGACNAYSQLLLKMTAPGVPDFFQGTELWRFSLTDPDNRRQVDFQERIRVLGELNARVPDISLADDLLSNWRDGQLKMLLTARILNLRLADRELFLRGDYLPLDAAGEHGESICSFARCFHDMWVIVAVPRLVTKVAKPGVFPTGRSAWGETALLLPARSPDTWTNLLTGELFAVSTAKGRKALKLGDVFSRLPFAVLVHRPAPS